MHWRLRHLPKGFWADDMGLNLVGVLWSLHYRPQPCSLLLLRGQGDSQGMFDDSGYRDDLQKCPARCLGPGGAVGMGVESQPPNGLWQFRGGAESLDVRPDSRQPRDP